MTDPLRVLLFGTEFPPSAAGTAAYTRGLALALKGRGLDVHVLTQAPKRVQADDGHRDESMPIPVTRIPFTRNVARRYARSLGSLQAQLRRLRPDCLWATNGMGTRVAGMISELPCPLITCARGSDIRTRLPAAGLWRRVEAVLQRRAYQRSAGIAAACGDLAKYAADQGVATQRLFISHSAFDFSRLESMTASLGDVSRSEATVLTVARLSKQKRVDVLLRAIALARAYVPALRLVVVGDGPQRGRLQTLARELDIEAAVEFVGALQPFSKQLCQQYQQASVFALTSVGEGLANVFMEAGAFGLPSLGSDSGGTPEILTDGVTGWLVRPDDPQHTADRLVSLFQQPDARHRMGVAARAWMEEEFSLETLGLRSLSVIESVVAGDGVPQHMVQT